MSQVSEELPAASVGRIVLLILCISGEAHAQRHGGVHHNYIESEQIPACPTASLLGNPPTIYEKVRLKIPDRLDQSGGRRISIPPQVGDDTSTGTTVDPTNILHPMDVDFTGIQKSSTGDAYQLRIILEGTAFDFAEPTTDAGITFHGVSMHVPSSYKADFCTDGLIHHSTEAGFKFETVLVYVKHRNTSSTTYPAGLNIWIKAKYAPDTPIMIDPKIKNNG